MVRSRMGVRRAPATRATTPHEREAAAAVDRVMPDQSRLEFLDITGWSDAAKFDLVAAVEHALGDLQREGPSSFASPEFVPGFVSHVERLLSVMEVLGWRRTKWR